MNAGCSKSVSSSYSDNPKSAIQNLKLAGIVALVITFAMCGVEVRAQQPKKIFRIGYLAAQDAAIESERSKAIRLAVHELGYIEGQNLAIEYRYVEGKKYDQARELAAELVSLKVDLILVSGGARVIQPARNATNTIPLVMVGQGVDPVRAGFVKSLARPGGNLTGITMLTRELSGKRLELLQEALPKISRVAVLYEPVPVAALEVKDLQAAARELRLTIQTWEVRKAGEFEKVFAAISKAHPDGLYIAGSTLVFANLKRTARFALKSRLASIYNGKDFVDEGGATILRGGSRGELPAHRLLRRQNPQGSQSR